MKSQMLAQPYIYLIITAVIGGTLARVATIREDYRQYPSFPNGYVNQIIYGFIAATLGAVSVPALMTNNYTAVTFLGLAVTQFQNLRRLVLKSLELLEETEFTKRGNAYIDGIAKTFESRNYISLIISLIIAISMEAMQYQPLILRIVLSLSIAILFYFLIVRFTKGKKIYDLADVRQGKITIQNDELYVDDFYVSNRVGIIRGQEMLLKEGLAVVVYPKNNDYRITLDNYGQRQAILFEITRSLGIKRYHFTRKNYEDGRIAFVVVPILQDIDIMIDCVKNTPVLESTIKSQLFLGQKKNKQS